METNLHRNRNSRLEIDGNDLNGFHLIMSVEGCDTYDTWYETSDEAIEDTKDVYNAPIDGWTINC